MSACSFGLLAIIRLRLACSVAIILRSRSLRVNEQAMIFFENDISKNIIACSLTRSERDRKIIATEHANLSRMIASRPNEQADIRRNEKPAFHCDGCRLVHSVCLLSSGLGWHVLSQLFCDPVRYGSMSRQ